MATNELTSPDFEVGTNALYRGQDFDDAVLPRLVGELLERLKEDAQLVYVAYSPGKDIFIVAFDLWLSGSEDMAVEIFEVKCAPSRVEVLKQLRTLNGFYGDPQKKVEADYPDLIELVLD